MLMKTPDLAPMTRDNLLDDLEAMVEAATTGTWVAELDCFDEEDVVVATIADPKIQMLATLSIGGGDYEKGYASREWRDAACIAALKNAAPELLRRARESETWRSLFLKSEKEEEETAAELTIALDRAEKAERERDEARASRDMLAEMLHEGAEYLSAYSEECDLEFVARVRATLAKLDALSRATSTTEETKP